MIFPSIIMDKIYWYKWRDLQFNLCKEYINKRIFNHFENGIFFKMKGRIYEFNYRICINEDYNSLYMNASGRIKVPKNYVL